MAQVVRRLWVRATLLGAATAGTRGSSVAETTAAPAMIIAITRYTSGQVQPPPCAGSTQISAMPPESTIASR